MHPIPLGVDQTPFLPLASPLRLSTWNVCFDKYLRPERNQALLQELETHRPHLMVFQEVTLPFVRALQACEWLQSNYWISGLSHDQIGVVMVGRVEVDKIKFHNMPSQMGRRLLVADLHGGLRIAGAHFESNRSSGETRRAQFETACALLESSSAGVLLGDFNSQACDPECVGLGENNRDAWTELRADQAGYTVDTEVNALAKKSNHSTRQLRIDRILCFGRTDPISIQRLGTRPFQNEDFPSDHFGLLAELTI